MIAALFVDSAGPYFDMFEPIDAWDERRDARRYAGPWPVVAHPPCQAWCQLAGLRESLYGYKKGDDGGCFESALRSVRTYGGVLEHPARSAAWPAFNLPKPLADGRWVRGACGGYAAEVCQGFYGHPVQKRTWLYVFGVDHLPTLPAGLSPRPTAAHRAGGRYLQSGRRRVSEKELIETPLAFRALMLDLAKRAHPL